MFVAWVVFHVVICLALIIVVLMQSAKGEGLAGGGTAFGGGVSNAVFGGRGAASFLSKATTFLAVVFFVNCGALALMSSSSSQIGMVGGGDGSGVESSVTRQAQADREQAMQRQQQQQEAALEDSLAQQNAQSFNLDSIAVGESQETPAADDTASGN